MLIAFVCLLAQVEEFEPTHRVHLRNRNLVDGILVRTDGRRELATLRLGLGLIQIRYSDIARMSDTCRDKCCLGLPSGGFRIHGIRPRTKGEKAILTRVEEPRKSETEEAPPVRTEETKRPVEKIEKIEESRTENTAGLASTSPAIRARVDGQLKKIRAAPPDEKDALIGDLTKLGPGCTEYLADLIDRVDEESSGWLSTALQGQKDERAISILLEKLKSRTPRVRWLSVETLSHMLEPDSAHRLRGALKDPDPQVRISVVSALEMLLDEGALPVIARMAADPDAMVGKRAGIAVRELATHFEKVDESVALLKEILPSAPARSRAGVIEALARLGRKDAADAILAHAADADPSVRAAVAQACGELEAEESVATLIERLGAETELWIQVQICDAFGKMRSQDAIEPLIALMEGTENTDLDETIARALAHITGQEGFGHDDERWREWWDKQKKN